jgi:hypothetical protein
MVVGLLIALYWLWQDLLGLLNFMNDITLWEVGDGKGGHSIYLSDLMLFLKRQIALTVILVSCPPGYRTGIGQSPFSHVKVTLDQCLNDHGHPHEQKRPD